MTSSTNASRTSRWCPDFLSRCCPRRAHLRPQREASSLDARVQASSARGLHSPLSNEKPLLEGIVSVEPTGAAPTSNIPIITRTCFSTGMGPSGISSLGLWLQPEREFTQAELGVSLRSMSLRSSEPPLSHPSPLLSFINSRSSFEGYTPPPKNSEKYDSFKYYNKLGITKDREDFPFFKEGSPSSEAAFAYLSSIMPTSGHFLEESYLRVNALLLGIKDPIYRRGNQVSFCRVPQQCNSVFKASGFLTTVDRIFKDEGMGDVTFYRDVADSEGRIYFIYQIIHSRADIAEKLQLYIKEFNRAIESAESEESEDLEYDKLDAIILFYLRCEQLQPVKDSHRTNLAVLNYHLAKYNFPCVLFKCHMKEIKGQNVSLIDYLSFDDLRNQVIDGMKDWCRQAGIPCPLELEHVGKEGVSSN